MRKTLVCLVAAALLIGVSQVGCSFQIASYGPPDLSLPEKRATARRTVIYARDGSVLEVLAVENRKPVPLQVVPLPVRWAFLAAEDHRFYEHHGVDPWAVARAIRANRKAGRIVQGASTITEQLIKNLYFVGEERTGAVKLREAAAALELERRWTKDQILEEYLNTIYLGAGAYGIQAASETYFSASPYQLSIAQGALLAGLARSPEGLSPFSHPDEALARRNEVVDLMVDKGFLDPALAEPIKAEPLGLLPSSPPPSRFPYFSDYVRQTFLDDPRFGATADDRAWFLYRGGLEIRTTVDPVLQAKAEAAALSVLPDVGDPDVGLAAVDPATGEVLAIVGGRNYVARRFNLATQAQRQAGSSFKTFALVTAIERGLDPARTHLDSTPRNFRLPTGEIWPVNNYDGQGAGIVTLETATVKSLNAAYAQLALTLGPGNIVGQARNMGIVSEMNDNPAVVLGGNETGVSPLEMASAYGSLANDGIARPPTPILSVAYADGTVVDGHHQERRAVSAGGAWVATKILEKAMTDGTGVRAQIGRPAAGKTGTTSDYADAWFAGYTPELATAVWVGYADSRISMRGLHGINVAGGTYPAQIWGAFMGAALVDRPVRDFRQPLEDFDRVALDPKSGLLERPWCKGTMIEMARVLVPREYCPQPPPPPPVTNTVPSGLTPTAGPSVTANIGAPVTPTVVAVEATSTVPAATRPETTETVAPER